MVQLGRLWGRQSGAMFLGRFSHNLDAKGRLAIPAKFRAELADGLVVTRGIDRCLSVYPLAAWQSLAINLLLHTWRRQFACFIRDGRRGGGSWRECIGIEAAHC